MTFCNKLAWADKQDVVQLAYTWLSKHVAVPMPVCGLYVD